MVTLSITEIQKDGKMIAVGDSIKTSVRKVELTAIMITDVLSVVDGTMVSIIAGRD